MQQYPYPSGIVLTDAIFLAYGGMTGTSTVAQRANAYLLAEEQMTEHLSAFLIPTTVTGTYQWGGGNPFILDYGHLLSIIQVTVSDIDWANSCSVNTETGTCSLIRNAMYGYIDVSYTLGCGGCGSVVGFPPYNVTVVYRSGLSPMTIAQPALLAALVLAAQINLNEWDSSLSNEGVADIGIRSFSNQSYSEVRVRLGHTAFGASAVSQRIARLVNKYRARTGLSFHR